MKRHLTISTEVRDAASRVLVATEIKAIEVLQKRGVTIQPYDETAPRRIEMGGYPGTLSYEDIEHIAQTFTRLADTTSCVFAFYVAPVANADGALCRVSPSNEVDGRVVRAFLWEAFCEA